MNAAADAALEEFRRGDISAEIALMRLVLAFGNTSALARYLQSRGDAELLRAAAQHRNGLAKVAALVAAGLTDERGGSIEAIRDQFDRAAALAPDAAVALYSLGSAETLAYATAEIATRLREWRLVGRTIAALDIGCGIGRLEQALAPELGHITGIDVSSAMIAEARRRCEGLTNVEFRVCDGADLRALAGRRFGLIVAVDSFPYLVAADPAIAARHVADSAGLLDPGGALAIFNYSYRGDLAADRADIARLAAANGFAVERDGTRNFTLWDGATFLLRKPVRKSPERHRSASPRMKASVRASAS